MHVAHVSFFLDRERREPEALLEAWSTLVDVANAARLGGARVTVLQASHRGTHIVRDGVDYRFVTCEASGAPLAHTAPFRSALQATAPDVFHVHGLGFPAEVAALADVAPHVPILLQDHADRPPRFWRRPSWRRGFAVAAGVAFCAAEQAEPFRTAGLLPAQTPVFEIPESTARFVPGDRIAARERSGLYGNPCVLWVGHLDANKDPFTVLDGVRLAAHDLPEMRLWCCFTPSPLETEVRERIAADAWLRRKVHLVGQVPHAEVETLMRAADLFVLGSHREGSGYALIEALACGLPPVVTDIPAFGALTGRGAIGQLWPRGDAFALARSLVAAWKGGGADASCGSTTRARGLGAAVARGPAVRQRVREHFERELSAQAVGRKLHAAYVALAARHRRNASPSGVDAA